MLLLISPFFSYLPPSMLYLYHESDTGQKPCSEYSNELQLNCSFICSKFKPNVRSLYFAFRSASNAIWYVSVGVMPSEPYTHAYYENMQSNCHFLIIMENSSVANHENGKYLNSMLFDVFLCSRVCMRFCVCFHFNPWHSGYIYVE